MNKVILFIIFTFFLLNIGFAMQFNNPDVPVEYESWAIDSLNISGMGKTNYYYYTNDAFLSDSLLFTCMNKTIVVLNISDINNPKEVSSLDLLETAYKIEVLGSYALIANGKAGLTIIDISDINELKIVTSLDTDGTTYDTYIDGFYAYLADGEGGMKIINILSFNNPVLVSSFDTDGISQGITVFNSIAYIADASYGLRIINVSNPSEPYELSIFDTPGCAKDVSIKGSYAFVADSNFTLQMIDVTDPAAPFYLSTFDTGGVYNSSRVIVKDSIAFVTEGSNGLRVINCSQILNPIEIGYFNSSGDANDLYLSDNIAFLSDGLKGLRIIDISNLTSPMQIGYFDTPEISYDVFYQNGYAYVAANDYGLRIIDVSDKHKPIEVGFCDTPGYAIKVFVDDDIAYVADDEYGIRIIDVSDKRNPCEVGAYNTSGSAESVYKYGDYIYVADGDYGLLVLNVANPESPVYAGNYNTLGYAYDIFVNGNYIYVADGLSGIVVFQNLTYPSWLSAYNTTGEAKAIVVSNGIAFVGDSEKGVVVINVKTPSNPVYISTYDTNGSAFEEYVEGKYLYLADYNGGIKVYKIENISELKLVGYYDSSPYAMGICVDSEYIYVAMGELYILKTNIDSIYPTAFNLIEPKGYYNESNTPMFVWEESYDSNMLSYKLYVNNITKAELNDTFYQDAEPMNDSIYVWWITAQDSTGNTTYSNMIDTLVLDITDPIAPVLITPLNDSYVTSSYFRWNKASDNYSGIKDYEIQIDTSIVFTFGNIYYSSDTFFQCSLDEQRYYFTIRSNDYCGNKSEWSEIRNFVHDDVTPSEFDLIYPERYNNYDITPNYLWNKSNDKYFKQYQLYVNGSLKATVTDTFFKELTPINEGLYIWYVLSIDSAGNVRYSSIDSMILDLTAPGTVLPIFPLDNLVVDSLNFIWSKSNENLSGIKNYFLQISQDSLFSEAITKVFTDTTANLDSIYDGIYFWRVRAVDNCDNYGDWSTRRTFLYDASAPTAFSLISPSGFTVDNTPTYLWHKSNDNLFKEYKLYVDDSLRTTLTDTAFTETSTKSDGVYEWYVVAYDSLNKSTNSNDKDTLIIDITVPARVTLMNPANGWYSKTNQHIWAKASDSLSGVKNYNLLYSADSLFVSAETLTVIDTTYSTSLDMIKYYWKVRAIDNCCNKGLWSTRWSFTFDTLSPTVFNLVSPDGINNSDNTPLYIWNKSEDSYFRYYRLYVNGALKATVTDTSFSETFNLADGQYVWSVDAYDYAGNIRQCVKPDTMSLDINKPSIPNLISPENNGLTSDPLFSWHKSTDNYSGIYNYELIYSDDSLFGIYQSASCADTFYSTSLTDQTYYWRVRAVDNYDNVGEWSTTWNFEFDGTIPAIPNLVYPIQNEEVSDSIVLFDWDVVIKSGSKEQDVESNAVKATQIYYIINIDTTKTFSSLIFKDTVTIDSISFLINMGGKYYWRVKAYDEALNQGNWTSIDSFELDVTKPTIPDQISPLNGIANNDAIFIWHKATDNYSGIKEYSLWLDIDSLFSSPDTFSLSDTTYAPLLSEQEYYWKVRAVDNFDNIGDWSTTWSFEFDSTIPATPILVSPLNNSTTASSIFTWNKSTDNYTGIKHYNLWFDNDSLFSTPDTITTTDTSYTAALGDYTYYWMVRAIDNAENTGNWSDVWSFDFSPAGITDKFVLDIKEKQRTELSISFNEIKYVTQTTDNELMIFDITGKQLFIINNSRTGQHKYSTENLSSGIYFIRFKDGDKQINKKMVIIR